MDLELKGKVALVTGGSRGIGRAIVLTLAREGANTAFTYLRSEDAAKGLQQEVLATGVQALSIRSDARDFEEAEEVVQRVVERFARLDFLINNAGAGVDQRSISEADESTWSHLMDSYLKSVFNYCRAATRVMKQQRFGRIINISSINGLRGRRDFPIYSAAKGGVNILSKAMAREMGEYGVTVNAVAPGTIETDVIRGISDEDRRRRIEQTPLHRLGSPEDVANLVAFLCSNRASFITGEIIKVDGGQYI